MEYPHKTILLNGKRIPVQKIIDGTAQGSTAFELSTLSFVRSWLKGQEKFTLKTSGSTGTPKKIAATRKQLSHSANLTLQALSIKPDGKILLCINPEYIGGKMMLVRAFVNSMSIEAYEPSSFNKDPKLSSKYTLAAFVPVQIQTFLNSRKTFQQLTNIEHILIGGAPLSHEDSIALSKSKTNIFATYGMTETFSHIALKRVSPIPENPFHVLPSIKISIDGRGCLVIKAPFLKKGIVTNDLVKIEEENRFNWLGRFDNVINSGGIKIIPEQTEGIILKIADQLSIQNRFYIHGEPDQRLGESVVLTMEEPKLKPDLQKQFISEMKLRLPNYHAPKKIRYVTRIETVNDKIKRK